MHISIDIETKNIKYYVISHFHPDHFGDIGHFFVTRYVRGEIKNPIKIIGPIGLEKRVKDINLLEDNRLELLENTEIIELEENVEVNIDRYKIKTIPLTHGNIKPTYGYIIEKDNKRIGYTCDTTVCDNFEEICKNVDYLIGDANNITTNANHMGLTDFTEYAKKYRTCKFYAIHRSDYEDRNEYVNFPEDGDVLNI